LYKHNLKFKINHARDKTKLWGCIQGMDVQKRCIRLGMEFGDVWDFRCESHVTECMMRLAKKDKHKDMIIVLEICPRANWIWSTSGLRWIGSIMV
jgi:hypothetical protein